MEPNDLERLLPCPFCGGRQTEFHENGRVWEGMRYLAWHEWAAAQHKAWLRQRQCCRCGLWNYPQELNVDTGACKDCSETSRDS